ncbi:ISL3 family transposase [uncultured Sphaerochaeta sp.]|uniref:ISL3 family transposase n=1 Tax=uncultured Sphaerochaeta sp. TaxID=886478 RepID=UPI002A0A29C6|nr:ISL3 family transposase [uncultured Sphaerochaeta sp.]
MHVNQHLDILLHHLSLGNRKIILEVGYEQYLCTGCHRTCCQPIPFKQPGHFATTCFQSMVEGFLSHADMTVKGLATALHTNRKLVREIDKSMLQGKYGQMLPTHYSAHLCVDEFSLHKGHRYATVVLDWQTGEILFLEEGNGERQLLHFFGKVGHAWMARVRSISMDMNAQYCKAVKSLYPHIHIVYDAFHIVKNFNERILTELRRLEQNRLREGIAQCKARCARLRKACNGAPPERKQALLAEIAELRLSIQEAGRKYASLKGSRYVITSSRKALMKKDGIAREHNRELADKYEGKGLPMPEGEHKWSIRNERRLEEILGEDQDLNLAFFLGDQLKAGLESTDGQSMRDGLEQWLRLSGSYVAQIPMLGAFNKMIRSRMDGIVSRVRFPVSNGPLEGTNNMIKTVRRQAYGYRDTEYFFLKLWDRSRRNPKHRSLDQVIEKRKMLNAKEQKSHKKIS